ncbi:MAG: cupin [Variovorax sp.]|nr:MAG: cupin [Variovorax sp.]
MFHEQIHTSVIDDESIPWVPFAPYSDDVLVKYFKADPIRGETITLLKAPAGTQLPRHHHSGTVIVYTIKGSWKYLEHDWIAGPGSIVFETAASSHTPQVIEKDGEVITLNIVVGDLVFLGENDQVLAIENWKTAVQRYEAYCMAADIQPRDITAFN